MNPNTLFETPRLLVRPLKISDYPGFHQLQSDPDVMKYTGKLPFDKEGSLADLEKLIGDYTKPNNDFWVWAVEEKEKRHWMGTCSLIGYPDAEIGYRLLKACWGKGYGRELAMALIDFAIHQKKVNTLTAYVEINNIASIKILEASPLNYEQTLFVESYKAYDKIYRWYSPMHTPLHP